MFRILALVGALAFAATSVSAQTIDAKGKCHDAKGKMAAMSVCKPATPASTAKAAPCKDAKGKFTKCPAATAEAVKTGNTASPASPETPHTSAAAAAAKPTPMATPASTTTAAAHPKNCKKGKACGNTCIAMSDVCHK